MIISFQELLDSHIDLLLEIQGKIKSDTIGTFILLNKKIHSIFIHYQGCILKRIINLYNLKYTKNHIACLYLIIENYYNIKFGNHHINKALIECSSKRIETIKFLVKNGANVRISQDILIRRAAEFGYSENVEFLIKNGADLNACDGYALNWASRNGHLHVIKVLAKYNVNIHSRNDDALFRAIRNGHLQVAEFLIGLGISIHSGGDDALKYAVKYSHFHIVKFLVNNGSDINVIEPCMIDLGNSDGKKIGNFLGSTKRLAKKLEIK